MKSNKPSKAKGFDALDAAVVDPTDHQEMKSMLTKAYAEENAPKQAQGIIIPDNMDSGEIPDPPQTGNKSSIIEAELVEVQEEGKAPVTPAPKKVPTVAVARGGHTYAERLAFKKHNLEAMQRRLIDLQKSIKKVKQEIKEAEKMIEKLNQL
jgi:hypothetical protein